VAIYDRSLKIMNTDQAQTLITAIITQPTASAAVEYAWENREQLLSPVCFRTLMDLLAQEENENGQSKRYQALTQLKHYRAALFAAKLQQNHDFEQEKIALTLPGLIIIAKKPPDVKGIVHLFKSGDITAKKAFIQGCPPSRFKETVLGMIAPYTHLDTLLIGLNILAETYCRGIDCKLGITLSKAIYLLSQDAFEENPANTHLSNARGSAINCAQGFQAIGRHEELIEFVAGAMDWLESKGYKDGTLPLLKYQIKAHINLAQFDQARKQLNHAKQLPEAQQVPEPYFLEQLEQELQIAEQEATKLASPPEKPKDEKQWIIDQRHEMIDQVESLAESRNVSSDDTDLITWSTGELRKRVEQNAPDSIEEWLAQRYTPKEFPNYLTETFKDDPQLDLSRHQSIADVATDYISGGGSELNQLQNGKRIDNAISIFLDPVKGHDPDIIAKSIPVLIEAKDWAKEHHFIADENSALWGLYLCYCRTERSPQAIETLQALRTNLEAIRSQISDPLKRAGVFRKFPCLFSALCEYLYKLDRRAELLEAIEGIKGRVLADVLTQQQNQPVSDQSFSEPARQLPHLMKQVKAHYLTYFVDDEVTYAVLVAKDGSLHIQAIVLGKKNLQELSIGINPKLWGKQPFGLDGPRIPKDFPDRFALLITWLEPLIESGILQKGDHICYCPDEELHLVPLHYVTFRGHPLVCYFSLSRIHGAGALVALLEQKTISLHQFTALQIPSQQDLKDKEATKKLFNLGQAPSWLAENFSGQVLKGETVDWNKIKQLTWQHQIVHFAMHGTFPDVNNVNSDRDPNPFLTSGLMLAKNGQLPDLAQFFKSGEFSDSLLTPERVLKLDFSGSHISMMACVTGLAKEGIGGDALGLEWAFLQVGATSILGTHWNIPASASAKFSLQFYKKWLVNRLPRSVAWRETLLELMNTEWSSKIPKPYYWAGFSLSGDWR
jgi:CHAT domain-containing protein